MAYLNLDLQYFSHPKTVRLVGILGESAALLPLKIWCYVGQFHCDNGHLEGYSIQEIESIAGWKGASGMMIEAMLRDGISLLEKIDGGYKVHDWLEHAGHLKAFKKRAKTANYKRWKDLEKGAKGTRSERLAKARKKGTHTKVEWEAMKVAFDYTCVRCFTSDYHIEKDHIVPLYLGGSDSIENIQPVCARCNASKTGETTDHRISYLIKKGKSEDVESAKCLLERLLNASQMPPLNQSNPIQSKPNQDKKKKSPTHAMPDDWSLTDEMRAYGEQKGMTTATIQHEFEHCREHHRKQESRFTEKGWASSVWTTWVLNWIKFGAKQIAGPAVPAPQVKCCWVNGGKCEDYAKPGSRYCEPHGVTVKKAQERVSTTAMGVIEDSQTVELLSRKVGRSM